MAPDNGAGDSTGRFRITGVSGRVGISPGSAPLGGWFLKRVSLNGVDVTTSGFDVSGNIDGIDVVFTDRAAWGDRL